MRAELPSGTVTFLFTDIEGSTRLLHELGTDAYSESLAEHRRVLRAAFAEHDGVEVDTQGDAFLVAFPTAPGAVAAAEDGQRALAAGRIRVRMGLHTGTPTLTSEGYVGVDVHRGARVAALAHGGQVLLTEATATLVDGVALTELGRHRLKDFDGPARVLQLGQTPFPPLRTPGTVSLPTPATRFVGRERELFAAVSLALDDDPAILSVVGPGGTGKTRFAIELARLLAEEADGGTLFVPLAPLPDATLALPALAEALGADGADPDTIAARVGEKRTHVVLDNLEHLLPDAAAPIAAVVGAAPALRLVITTREALRVGPETRFDLAPLAADDARELFLARARAVRPDLEPSPAVERLCARLDFLPLALELAAARTGLLSPDALLERLGARLDLPAPRDADPRHATLRATIAWSYDLLTPDEQRLFASLALFRAGCTLDAAETVCLASLDHLGSLLDKSLVRRRTDSRGNDRFWMLETIQEFARSRLAELGDEDALRRRHAEWALTVAEAANLSIGDLGRRQDFPLVLSERESLRDAIDWAIHGDPALAAEIVLALEHYWVTGGPADGRPRVEALLASPTLSDATRARLLRQHGGIVVLSGDRELGEQRYREAMEIFRRLGDDNAVVGLLARFAVHSSWGSDAAETRRLVAEVRAMNEGVGNPQVEPQMLSTLAHVAEDDGDLESALELSAAAVKAAEANNFDLWRLWELEHRLALELDLGRVDDAEQTGREGLELARRLDDRRVAALLLGALAAVALRRGDQMRAGTLWGAARAASGGAGTVTTSASTDALLACSDPRFLAAVDEGALLDLESAIDLALASGQTVP